MHIHIAPTSSNQAQMMQVMTGSHLPVQADSSGGDLFDGSAEPIVYMSENRMPVVMELSSAIIYIIFATLLLALLSILPGIRRKKMTSFVGLFTLIVVGTSILLAFDGSHWLTGSLRIHRSSYGALTSETITGKLGVHIGLSSTNVTLFGRLMGWNEQEHNNQELNNSTAPKTITIKFVDYNERFHWDRPDRMGNEHQQALRRGLPYPILTITEFLSQDSDGFNWMRQLRHAGYFTSLALYAALASWLLTAIIMCVLPVYLPHMMQITGAFMMSSVWIYTLLIESPKSFVVRLGETPMEFEFGHTYVMTFMGGALSMFSGVMMFIMQLNKPHDQMTIMDCDDYVKNQKALNGSPKGSVVDFIVSGKDSVKVPTITDPKSVDLANHNVIIPINDIEERFSPNTNSVGQT